MGDPHLHEVLKVLSAPVPSPAGVSAAAVTAATGAALLVMVAEAAARHLPEGSEKSTVEALGGKAARFRNMLEDIYEQDAHAFGRIIDIQRLPRGPERTEALERAWKTATIIPGAMGRAAMICMKVAGELAPLTPPIARPDISCAVWFCHAAAEASVLIVLRNLSHVRDLAFREKITRNLSFMDERDLLQASILAQVAD